MKNTILVILVFTLCGTGCKLQKRPQAIAGSYTYDTECLDVALDGSETLKAWGVGRNRAEAVEQAKKNGLRDVLFKGIIKGKPDCNVKPVLPEVNIQEKNEAYFDHFFADGGDYKSFISMKDEPQLRWKPRERKRAVKQVEFGIVINVRRGDLIQKMINDKILKP